MYRYRRVLTLPANDEDDNDDNDDSDRITMEWVGVSQLAPEGGKEMERHEKVMLGVSVGSSCGCMY